MFVLETPTPLPIEALRKAAVVTVEVVTTGREGTNLDLRASDAEASPGPPGRGALATSLRDPAESCGSAGCSVAR